MKRKSLLIILLLALGVPIAMNAQSSLPFSENFESTATNEIPSGWTRFVTTGAGTSFVYQAGTNSKVLMFGCTQAQNNEASFGIQLPTNSSGDQVMRVSFTLRGTSTDGCSVGSYGTSFNQIGESYTPTTGSNQTKQLEVYMADGERIAFVFNATGTTGFGQNGLPTSHYLFIDNVQITSIRPTNLAVTSEGTVTWNANNASKWELQYKINSDSDWTSVNQVLSTNSFTLENLISNTTYDVRVRAKAASANYYTAWSSTFTFTTTNCPAPTGLEVSDITATGATFAWDAEEGEVFQYFMRPLPYTYDAQDFIRDNNESYYHGPYTYAVSFLPDTDNIFYLRKKCGENVFSEPVSLTFHTLPTCPAPTGLHVAELTAHTVRLEWDAEEGDLFQPLMPGGQPTYPFDPNNPPTTWNTVAQTDNFAIWNTLSPETTYGVWLRKYCSESDQSEPIYIMFTTPEACPAPTGLTVSDVTSTGATFAWNAEEGEEFEYFMRALPYTYNEADFINDGNDGPYYGPYTYPVSFDPDTDYIFYLRKKCGENVYSDPVSVEFHTPCGFISALGYSENFDELTVPSEYNPSVRALPSCWSAINTTTYELYSVYPSIYNYNNNAYSGSNCLTLYSSISTINDLDPQPQYAILPMMDDLSGIQVTLWAKGDSNNTGVPSSFKIGTMSDPDDVSTFSLVTEQPLTTSYEKYDFYIPSTTDKYIAFMIDAADSNRDINGVYIDDIVIPTCSKPRGLRTTELTAHSVRIEWFEEEGAMFQEVFNTMSFDPNTPPTDWGTYTDYDNFAEWDGLEPEHFYGIWVRKYCSETDQSEPIYITFTTPEACPAPTGLTVSNVTSTGATFNWDAEAGATFYYYTVSDPWEGYEPPAFSTDYWTDTQNNTVGWANGFSPNTVARFYLLKDCGDDGISDYTYVEFRTLCGPISLGNGYSEDFDSFTNVSTNEYDTPTGYPDVDLPYCWQFLNRSESADAYPQAFLSSNSEYAVSGNCLFFKSSSTTPLYAVLPEFEQDIAEYHLL